jgi:hypothetical protein
MKIEELELLLSNYPPETNVLFTLGDHISMNYVLAFPVPRETIMLELCNLDDTGVSQGLPDNLTVVDKDELETARKVLALVIKCRRQDLLATKLETEGDPDGKLKAILDQLDYESDELMAVIDKHIESTR